MTASQVCEWVARFYATVDRVAEAHGVRKAEVRGDCCVCVSGSASAAGAAWHEDASSARDRAVDQVTRMLDFAADLHHRLGSLASSAWPRAFVSANVLRMGMA